MLLVESGNPIRVPAYGGVNFIWPETRFWPESNDSLGKSSVFDSVSRVNIRRRGFRHPRRRFRAFGRTFPAGNLRFTAGIWRFLGRQRSFPARNWRIRAGKARFPAVGRVFPASGGGRVQEIGVFLHENGGFVQERPVFLLPDGVFLLPVAVACRKSAFSGTKTGGASRESQRSCSRAAISITFLKKCLTRGREAGTLGPGNKSPTLCRIMINLGSFTINRACSTMRRRLLRKENAWLKLNSKSTT